MNIPGLKLPAQNNKAVTINQSLVMQLAAATALSVGTQYYNQPLLGVIAQDFGLGSEVSLVSIATQIGYALGLVLLVPPGDRINRRLLIIFQCIGLVVASLCASVAPGLYSLALASLLIGVFATIAQQIIPFASELSPTASRQKVLTTLTSALLVGVLMSRVISGFIGEWFSWRAMFLLGSLLSLIMLAAMVIRLPHSHPQSRESYPQLLLSLFTALRDNAELRNITLLQSLLFFCFSAFWTILTLLLQGPQFNLSSGAAGLFGIVALFGVILAPPGLRLTGRHAVTAGIGLVMAAFALMISVINLAGLGIGAVLMTTGLQIALISNQSRILTIAGAAKGRFNTVFMASQFAFGAAGSAAASLSWKHGGWIGVMGMAVLVSLGALLLQLNRRRQSSAGV